MTTATIGDGRRLRPTPRQVRRWAGLEEGAVTVGAAEARAAGRRLAAHSLLGGRSRPAQDPVTEALDDAAQMLEALGIRLSATSKRPGLATVTVSARRGADVPACPLVTGLLEALPPELGYRVALLETACHQPGGPCEYTLLWRSGPAAAVLGSRDQLPVKAPGSEVEAKRSAVPPLVPGPTSEWRGFLQRRLPAWLWRRAWIPVLALALGALGGHEVAARHHPTYTAQATVVVQSGATATGPGSASAAANLAISFASYIPSDGPVLRAASGVLGVSPSTVGSRLSASATKATAVIDLSYSAPTEAEAVRGASVVAYVLAETPPKTSALPAGSIKAIHLPTTATSSSKVPKYALPAGALLGLFLGVMVLIALERANPAVDDQEGLADLVGCPTISVPGPVGPTELARALSLRQEDGPVALVPATARASGPAAGMADQLEAGWPPEVAPLPLVVTPDLDSGTAEGDEAEATTVLVARAGTSARRLRGVVERLELVGRPPNWAVLYGPRYVEGGHRAW